MRQHRCWYRKHQFRPRTLLVLFLLLTLYRIKIIHAQEEEEEALTLLNSDKESSSFDTTGTGKSPSPLLEQWKTTWSQFWQNTLVAPTVRHLATVRSRLELVVPSVLSSDATTTSGKLSDTSSLPAIFQTDRRGRVATRSKEEDGTVDRKVSTPRSDTFTVPSSNYEEQEPLFCRQDKFSPEYRTDSSVEPHIGMVLEVYTVLHDRICASSSSEDKTQQSPGTGDKEAEEESINIDVVYQLEEPMHMDLGTTVKHAADFAYDPVITAGTESIRISEDTYEGVEETPVTGIGDESEQESLEGRPHLEWWHWWIPWWKWDGSQDHSQQYRMHSAFAGGSHGEVWRGRRKCRHRDGPHCDKHQRLVFKRLKIENGYRVLEAGLREIYFGDLLTTPDGTTDLFTQYEDHFFRERENMEPELWIVFRDAGLSLRSFIYTGTLVGDFILFQHSPLWTQLRTSVQEGENPLEEEDDTAPRGRGLFRQVLKQVLESAAFLHRKGVVHRDIKPSNVMCTTNINPEETAESFLGTSVHCVLGDFSSAWDKVADTLYTGGPSRAEQTDEYAPPESFFDEESPWLLSPAFDSWSIGIVALELLLGTPNVFTVDQRTKALLTHKLQHQGVSEKGIQRALYLAALSQFCIYNPQVLGHFHWPLGVGDPLHNSAMVKGTCTLHDFHRALRARDPLGIGFDSSSDQLLLLIWQLLAWDPSERITATDALKHPYFSNDLSSNPEGHENKALESQMLDPRRDFNVTDVISEFVCPQCGRVFSDWKSCNMHANARKHAKFCHYDHSNLPTCLNAHSMLPAHVASGHCDIQGRRRVIEDMHAVQLTPTEHFYGIFDGHSGNRASKYAASFLFAAMKERVESFLTENPTRVDSAWNGTVSREVQKAFLEVHDRFLDAIALIPQSRNDQSGTTATVAYVTGSFVIIASLGDSRAVLSTYQSETHGAVQLTNDHAASDPAEKRAIEDRGGTVLTINGVDRVNGTVVVTRSLGDSRLSNVLSQTPDVLVFSRDALLSWCGDSSDTKVPCFLILASDGLWDAVSNQEAVDLVVETIQAETNEMQNTALQRAAEALVHEAYVRGSSDNIGVCVLSLLDDFRGEML